MLPLAMTQTQLPFPEPAAEFERTFRWRWWAMLGFLGLMLILTAMAIASIVVQPRILTGVPDDPDARAAWALIPPAMDAGLLELRFDSSLGVTSTPDGRVHPDQVRRAERAEALLLAALKRHPDDPRIHSALGHLDLVRQRPHHAERRYSAALDLAQHHDEARLGLGVTLARLAELEADPIERRRLQLRAIAQLAAVRESAPVRLDAVFDRAVLLVEVGRKDEARRWAAVYLASDPASAWAAQLRAQVPGA
jgi:tetratricopeptide (TPR) repeat protein